jgi:hypothetical protein
MMSALWVFVVGVIVLWTMGPGETNEEMEVLAESPSEPRARPTHNRVDAEIGLAGWKGSR